MTTITVRCSVCLGSQSAVTLMISNHPYEYKAFALHDIFSKSKYGDMQAFVKKLKELGYEKVELIDTTEQFMKKWEPVWMELSGSALLVGKK